MNKKTTSLPWISILVALASAVGIYFLPAYHLWFLAILLLNVLVSLAYSKRYNIAALTICRILVGALFIFSSFTKGVDPLGTKYKILDYLAAYNMTWLNGMAMVLSMGLILAEFLVGICLLIKVYPRLAVLGATLLMLFFTITTLFDALYNLVPDCGCFGTAVKMSNWQTFYKNLVIDALLIPLIMNNKLLENKLSGRSNFIIASIFALLFLGFEVYNYRHLPVIDFMNWKVGKQMNVQSDDPARIYLTFKNRITGEKQEYLSSEYPWNDSVWAAQWEFVDQRVDGDVNVLGFSALDADGDDVTDMLLNTENLLMFTSNDLTKVSAKEWDKVKEITNYAENRGYIVVWTVANEAEYVEYLRTKYDFLNEVFYADELEIKTIVRSNPGLIWLDNGLVKDKWSSVDLKKVLKAL
ncbi:MAG: DoxX family protein [Bacteroidales bacterium]|nr:DoxX family protein [Bacteroidales bacterium]MBR0538710.1 DoxX family protein [Bacteroidales bacterium]